VILGQIDCLAVLTEDTAGITCVAAVDVRRRDKNDVGGAACLIGKILAGDVVRVLTSKTFKFFSAVRTEEHLVNLYEDSYQGLLVVPRLE